MISLAGGMPNSDLMDIEGLDAACRTWLSDSPAKSRYQYSLTEGEPSLRQMISDRFLSYDQGVDIDDVLITTGSQQGLELAFHVAVAPGEKVIVERPTYLAALQILDIAGIEMASAGGDEDGIALDEVEDLARSSKVGAVYVVPDFANPTGRVMALERRRALIELSEKYGFYIIEDNPYGKLRFSGQELPTIHQLARSMGSHNCIHVASFSKFISPGLRVGWVTAEPSLLRDMVIMKQSKDLHTSTMSQNIVSHYLASGRLEANLDKAMQGYRQRMHALADALNSELAGSISFTRPEGGMFLWGTLEQDVEASTLLQLALEEGVAFVPGAEFYPAEARYEGANQMRLSYSGITPEQAGPAVMRLKSALRKLG
ncbi:PLP-dependent aminotransferase family protein [Halomonas binhaiensis]|uniref:PLP-dependent aminotransferase family protein n=1 Tax=Halomonas binhaiensis TaxID=2562282 RepID=A0A856QQR1_9GAMM|nr:PLP-dependent aminotransferase family protein [Halomonas binhaiensis]QEM82287.2 PLP-dependent aminotransferase family protein [Halomonas binhaiensis]